LLTAARILHAIEGRLRIRVPEIKRHPAYGQGLCDAICCIDGIADATPNMVTGSVTITYDPAQINEAEVCNMVAGLLGCKLVPPVASAVRPVSPLLAETSRHVAQLILKSAMEAALKRAIYSLI
jgi:hypothetical protein